MKRDSLIVALGEMQTGVDEKMGESKMSLVKDGASLRDGGDEEVSAKGDTGFWGIFCWWPVQIWLV